MPPPDAAEAELSRLHAVARDSTARTAVAAAAVERVRASFMAVVLSLARGGSRRAIVGGGVSACRGRGGHAGRAGDGPAPGVRTWPDGIGK
ncbi:hypothetical protein ALMP_79590 [Streptomyces sp. A012304]|nr:hypothetical protein ALMP_79590 [Streptomyces sp. A012304]